MYYVVKHYHLFCQKTVSAKVLEKFSARNIAVVDFVSTTVKILKIGTPEIITIIVLQLEQLDFTVQYCVQKMQTEQQTEKTLIRLLHEEQSDLGLHCLLRPICPNI